MNHGCQFGRATKFCTVATNVYGSRIRSFLRVCHHSGECNFQVALMYFWKIFATLVQVDSELHAVPLKSGGKVHVNTTILFTRFGNGKITCTTGERNATNGVV
jgi:hypothetical protein